MENNNGTSNGSSTSGIVIGVLVIVVIAIVGWIAYSQGFFAGKDVEAPKQNDELQINVQMPQDYSDDTSGTEPTY